MAGRIAMGKLIYGMLTSLDGYVADENGNFDWAEPDEQVHAFVNDRMRTVGTHLYGRRMYDVMQAWETMDDDPDLAPVFRDFARLWQAADKIVYSTTLESTSTTQTRIERVFDPAAIQRLKASANGDLVLGGPTLAAEAFKAGLVDECHLYLAPIVVGGGTRSLPDKVRQPLELLDERRFDNGMVFVRYRAL